MNLAKDPVIRRRLMQMTIEIFDKAVISVAKAAASELTIAEKKAIDRLVVKYIETAKYVVVAFRNAISILKETGDY
ncbi:hypothetical protein TVAG_399830 [Trichomonas vaginalis G3]|uniref:Uncharacterized protein n=1 Tax=Trichomonas vaginalis (strain ATCC PRA-98 / G3) TaxID=412133 RepID=A2G8G6_TRIV3|nr:hypothetical protein TVAGG3_0582930 [Trichomonas vaginalis G3]EAX86549.1 hypothetical protein TVAG_399830 [Trichomonas vaginalis G3]KAI5522701.1 hypothetical protein TVAGG3_0582930 [Trichomonas vaginalis G3]|eukprot:XP_001299479.1 hypothetical protein [Trichomonas vaginalis G3]